MKKLLILTLLSFAYMIGVKAQSYVLTPALDTNTNIMTNYLTTGVQNGKFGIFSLQLVTTKLTGTVAGYALVQASIDNNNWRDVNTDTFQLANVATQSKLWALNINNYLYYRVQISTTNAAVTATNTALLWRKE